MNICEQGAAQRAPPRRQEPRKPSTEAHLPLFGSKLHHTARAQNIWARDSQNYLAIFEREGCVGRHGLGTSVRPSRAAPRRLVWLTFEAHCSGDANQTRPLRAPPLARHLVHKVAAGATVRETAEVGVRRRRVAARRQTTITRHLSMLPPAPRVVGSWRQIPGTLRADADHRGWSWATMWGWSVKWEM